jgi:hypothetical protein
MGTGSGNNDIHWISPCDAWSSAITSSQIYGTTGTITTVLPSTLPHTSGTIAGMSVYPLLAPPSHQEALLSRLVGLYVSLNCPECLGALHLTRHPLQCKACDREYEGDTSIRRVVIQGAGRIFEIHEGVCACGCLNASRILFHGECPHCHAEITIYLASLWDDQFFLLTGANPPGTTTTCTVTPPITTWTYPPFPTTSSGTFTSVATSTSYLPGMFNVP